MTQIDFQAQERRLYLNGSCRDGDAETIRQALTAFRQLAGPLVVDLTAVTDLSHRVAELLVEARMAAREVGEDVVLDREPGSDVDRALLVVETDLARARPEQ